jgi:hypothetical protein
MLSAAFCAIRARSVGAIVAMTMLIPSSPIVADTPTDLGTVAKVGIALDGVPFFADAPSVLENRSHARAGYLRRSY